MAGPAVAQEFPFFGNRLCLDFAATLRDRLKIPLDLLRGFPDLVAWLKAAGVVDRSNARRLLVLCRQQPQRCKGTFRRALELREAINRVFTTIATGETPSAADVEVINQALVEGRGHTALVPHKGHRYLLRFVPESDPLSTALVPIAQSAADLLSGGRRTLIRKCAKADCAGLFYDTSRTRRRRWCLMEVCGNLVKVKRFYRRHPRRRRTATPAERRGAASRGTE